MNDHAHTLANGCLFAGRYTILKRIAAGGMGCLFRARDNTDGSDVVIKVMRPELAEDATSAARFLREASIAATLECEHAARVITQGKLEDSTLFMVLEYLEGIDLGVLISEHGPLPIADAVDLTLQTLSALHAAHKMGIVHRDIKPSNLFVVDGADNTRHLKVLDFGISKAVDGRAGGKLTSAKTAVGTPTYMAPEQIQAEPDCDHRMDVWAVGVVLFEMLTGRIPFEGNTPGRVFTAVLTRPVPSPLTLRDDIPPALGDIIVRCLDKDPANRFPSAHHLLHALAPFGSPRFQHLVPDQIEAVTGRRLVTKGQRVARMLAAAAMTGLSAAVVALALLW